MKQLMTVGYEKSNLEDFVSTLTHAGVTILLDIRELPISRRKGFSKTALKSAVQAAGIAYQHERCLGSPKEIRQQLRTDGDYTLFFSAFSDHLETQQDLLSKIADDLTGSVALMCYERDPKTCHRTVVARYLEDLTGLTTKHIEVANGSNTKGAGAHTG